ncbi:MAG TPA: hypothetical protein VEJ39_07740, partial [Candidatus Acidoferrales bacterium]|nr:hypothetical protein [Candidatus Acidoferrales bacterium]
MLSVRPPAIKNARKAASASSLCFAALLFAVGLAGSVAFAQQFDPSSYAAMRWRLIGPYRAGRVTCVAGIPTDPAVYYMGTPDGGVWKTTDGGHVWKPIFDATGVASIGALALAPSNPSVVYVGTGEQAPGNGVYKSADAGATWTNIGLPKVTRIAAILVDPRDPNTVLVAGAGDMSPETGRGIFKTTDGGKTWNNVLHIDDKTGAFDMTFDPGNRRIVYATLWSFSFSVPGEPQGPRAVETAIYKSANEGSTWTPIAATGLPPTDKGRIGIAVAPGNKGRRLYAILNQGLYRSDDAGQNWYQSTQDPRVVGNFYFSRVFVDPVNADIVYVVQTALYRSTDGGKTFSAFKGAPGGDDYHVLWIDPQNPQRMILGVDQGATISVDGGQTWSLWYNQPTGQFYHVSVDNYFPYRVYGDQQDSGTAAVLSRSNNGEITASDWFPIAGFEIGHIAADPLDPNLVYSIGWYHTVQRFDRTTGQVTTVFVPGDGMRANNDAPLEFSPLDPHTLYYGTQLLMKTSDAGVTWQNVSPDLTVKAKTPESAGKEKGNEKEEEKNPEQRGTISALAISTTSPGELWVGTSNDIVQVSRDAGATWREVTPKDLPEKTAIGDIETSPQQACEAYVALRSEGVIDMWILGGTRGYLYRTRDCGATWEKAQSGIPEDLLIRSVRADTVRHGLLFAGTENGVYVSFDDGDRWQSLTLNLPPASVRGLAIHGDDLVAATFGRSLWILDDITPLRQLSADVTRSSAYFFEPQKALRIRWDTNPDTPLPPEYPAGQNPPDGAILDYFLKTPPTGEITLSILDSSKNVIRQYSSAAPEKDNRYLNVPDYWFGPPSSLPKNAGLSRFVWDLRYPHPNTLPYGYFGQPLEYVEFTLPNDAIPSDTPRDEPTGALVVPGEYEAVLKIDGQEYSRKISVELDPRVHATQDDLVRQLDLAEQINSWIDVTYRAHGEVESLRDSLAAKTKALDGKQAKDAADAIAALDKTLLGLERGDDSVPGFGPLNRDLTRVFE